MILSKKSPFQCECGAPEGQEQAENKDNVRAASFLTSVGASCTRVHDNAIDVFIGSVILF